MDDIQVALNVLNKESDADKIARNRSIRVLEAPQRYDLSECLRELKFGRPAADQIWLDERIKELEYRERYP
jgi:hypothetical protein